MRDLDDPSMKWGGGPTQGNKDQTARPKSPSLGLGSAHPMGVDGVRSGQRQLQRSGIPWEPRRVHQPLASSWVPSLSRVLFLPCPPARCKACVVHLLTLELKSCPVLGFAAAVPCIGRRAQKLIKPAKGEGLGGLGKWMGIEVGDRSSFAQGCPFTEQISFGLTLEAGSGLGGDGALH